MGKTTEQPVPLSSSARQRPRHQINSPNSPKKSERGSPEGSQSVTDSKPARVLNPTSAQFIDTGERANKWVVLAIVAAGVFMSTLDSSIVNISLPTIASYFGVSLSGAIEWVVIAYLVIIAAILLTIGRIADMIGRKPVWIAGLVVFTIGSALCGLAPSLGFLIAARAFQGIGGALLFAIGPAMLTSVFPPGERGRALGMNAVTVALGVSAGPTLGGIITESISWRWIFYVNVPIGLIAAFAAWRILTEPLRFSRGRFDPAGAILLGVGLALLTLGLSFGQEWGWTSPLLIGTLVIALIAITTLVVVETRISNPILDLSLFKNRVFASANVSLALSFLALFAVSFMLPFYFEELRGFSTLKSGLLLTPLPLTVAVFAPISGALADRIGTRVLAATGLGIACIGLLLISQLDAHSSLFDIIWRLMVTGFGQALFQSPNNSALMGAAPGRQAGVASGLLATGRVVGQSMSVAVAGAIFASLGGTNAGRMLVILNSKPHIPTNVIAQQQQTFVTSFHAAFIVCACIAAIGVGTSLVRGQEH
jgi:EmrB/QacA subfamily drug resistance transporter